LGINPRHNSYCQFSACTCQGFQTRSIPLATLGMARPDFFGNMAESAGVTGT
jgi:hypothetical protein